MFKPVIAASCLLMLSLSAPAAADISRVFGKASKAKPQASAVKPPDGYASQWWTHPSGCEYSRAGRPGETVWYLIINTAKRGCPIYIVSVGFSDAY